MTKTGKIFVVGLLVLFFSAAGSALAYTPPSLEGTTWTGTTETVTSIQPNTTSTTPFPVEIKFTFESEDFLTGTFIVVGPTALTTFSYYFSAILNGKSLSIVAVSESTGAPAYIIHAWIMPVCHLGKGTPPPATMFVKGISLLNGSQFEGTLTETVQ